MATRKQMAVHPITCLKEHEWGVVEAQIEENKKDHAVIIDRLDAILSEVKRTNGRVTSNENAIRELTRVDTQTQLEISALSVASVSGRNDIDKHKKLVDRVMWVGGTVAAIVGISNLPELVKTIEQFIHSL